MKNQCTKIAMIGLIGIALETLTGNISVLAQQVSATSGDETSVISVENVKPLETPSGTPQDLGEIQGENNNQWTWGAGGDSQTTSQGSEIESVYQINEKSQKDVPTANWQQDHQDWNSRNRGDYSSSSSKIPFAEF